MCGGGGGGENCFIWRATAAAPASCAAAALTFCLSLVSEKAERGLRCLYSSWPRCSKNGRHCGNWPVLYLMGAKLGSSEQALGEGPAAAKCIQVSGTT